MHLLIVEDHEDQAQSLSLCLRLMGHSADSVATAESALILMQGTRYNCLAVDYFLPGGMDGVQLIRRLRGHEEWRDLPVMLMTAGGDDLIEQIKHDLSCLQPATVIRKPFYPAQFFDMMQRLRGEGNFK